MRHTAPLGSGLGRFTVALLLVGSCLSATAAERDTSFQDTMADWLTIFVLCFVPIVGVIIFWLVHVLPEKIAHHRHHPQRDAITTLCLLSLLFGGLLWPLAWLWAFTKPIGYRAAYGTDKHEDYYDEMAEKHRAGGLAREDLVHLREDLEAMEARGALPPRLRALKDELTRLHYEEAARLRAQAAATAQKGGA
ncbi:DUF3302 domain-containing protein [Variovorax sp. dw_954]|uniref:DUF3302 domain-containing protein n=1 Tax=Variovorax sp. dw_954 TaxID=2720078 RepID=UPI001BD6863A|nr:DUF3302 domain-containing protein [Variovorax sp. dw_954]